MDIDLPGLKLAGATFGGALIAIALWLAVAFGVFALLGYGFMYLWAWYVPVFWAGAPMLDFWHSYVTMLLLTTFLRRSTETVTKKTGSGR